MAHAYTPGLKIIKHATIERQRILPLKGEVRVKKGDLVHATDVVAGTHLPGRVHPVNLAHKFSIPPEDVLTMIQVQEGDEVTKNQLLAETEGFFGFFKAIFESPITGKLESISKVTGQIMLREPPTPLEVVAYISGEIKEVIPEEGVVVETQGALFQGIFGIGGEKEGLIRVVAKSPEEVLTPDKLTADMKGCVVVGGSKIDLETYQRALELGIVGLIVGGFDDTLVKKILGYDIGVAITGTEDLVTTLIMTEGFGEMVMATKTFELFQEVNGKQASLNGATQIRAGVMRPEIIVPTEEKLPKKKKNKQEGMMELGSTVRIIREPYFGMIGEVSSLPFEPVAIETEAKVRILKVKLKSGKKVILPRANVELIEG